MRFYMIIDLGKFLVSIYGELLCRLWDRKLLRLRWEKVFLIALLWVAVYT